ncbi:hypothetical protein J6590_035457 [Homalodisca vitripennis]|nr:hypothetical protein J6590_035455 [Homalodisca vitripennis]KAG8248689.1 hypothetical protein J6590_035457 [Homalodisca vitripennis]
MEKKIPIILASHAAVPLSAPGSDCYQSRTLQDALSLSLTPTIDFSRRRATPSALRSPFRSAHSNSGIPHWTAGLAMPSSILQLHFPKPTFGHSISVHKIRGDTSRSVLTPSDGPFVRLISFRQCQLPSSN